MLSLIRTTNTNRDFIKLVVQLDTDLAQRDGEDHGFYDQFNGIEGLNHTIVAYQNKKPIGCGALKQFDGDTVEIKRMYTVPKARGKGLATSILQALEVWAKELGYTHCILETGKKQPEALALYRKSSYHIIPNYGQYSGIENSICFQKCINN
ncbi:GNAT family N-acetyltransferase [Costertonia aggregata]|uniref:GNAT family N-acetyltransferase n=1 Tax=Costertonia aggregata TaxID=343403 RepID=A0A7H9AKP3_9FLAO|nr:GNAT family N-acetyltransferase [Costertonia aggregata]QLG43855.1 GNAT family N-acetyltransferase [Costertonia aggregata]